MAIAWRWGCIGSMAFSCGTCILLWLRVLWHGREEWRMAFWELCDGSCWVKERGRLARGDWVLRERNGGLIYDVR
jgi:hypothetical protein